jgi:hypothetical protein
VEESLANHQQMRFSSFLVLYHTQSLILPFLTGSIIHIAFKSTLYPTIYNIKRLILSTILLLVALTISFSVLHSVALFIGFLTSLTLHRLFFSPLNTFRGPILAKLSKLWQVNNFRAGLECHYMHTLFEEYKDDWIRIGPNELVCRDLEAIKDIYTGPSE